MAGSLTLAGRFGWAFGTEPTGFGDIEFNMLRFYSSSGINLSGLRSLYERVIWDVIHYLIVH